MLAKTLCPQCASRVGMQHSECFGKHCHADLWNCVFQPRKCLGLGFQSFDSLVGDDNSIPKVGRTTILLRRLPTAMLLPATLRSETERRSPETPGQHCLMRMRLWQISGVCQKYCEQSTHRDPVPSLRTLLFQRCHVRAAVSSSISVERAYDFWGTKLKHYPFNLK